MKKLLLIGLLGLAGCATTPVSVNYLQLATQTLTPEYCAKKGWMPMETAAFAVSEMTTLRNKLNLDLALWEQSLASVRSSFSSVTPDFCKQQEFAIQTYIQQQKAERQQGEDIQTLKNQMPKPPVTTFCNRIGDQVFCNSY